MPTTFDTTQPNLFKYANDLLTIHVLGGIKLPASRSDSIGWDGLDRLRVTLKVALKESSRPPVRHNLDLYNDNQLEKFIRKTAERLEIGTSVIAASLSELTEQLEGYRLSEIEKERQDPLEQIKLTNDQRTQAETFLQSDNLLETTNKLIGQSGVIGEETNRLLMYLIFTSRKRPQPLHVISLGASGIGKTHLQDKVGQLIPIEDKVEITTLSENAFYYFGQRELKNKLILIEDLDGAEGVLYPLRELQSKKRISKTVAHKNSKGETKTVHLIVEGPVSVSGCTTRESLYEDNANRSFLLYLDESSAQDKAILAYQKKLSAGKVDQDKERKAQELISNCQRILEPITVINPYAEQLHIPEQVFKPRRTNSHYLAFIEAVTFYHQYQREQKLDKATGEIYIETTLEDIEAANQLLKQTLLRKSDPLSGACRNYFETLKQWLRDNKDTEFTNRKMSMALRVPITTIKRYHLQLFDCGYIKKERTQQEDNRKKAYHYEITSYKEYQELQSKVETVLDKALENLKKGKTGPVRPTKKSGPLKAKKTS